MLRKFKVIFEHNENEGGFTVTVPALPGCFTEGDTVEEALENAREAIPGYLEALKIQGKQLPEKDIMFLQELKSNCATPTWSLGDREKGDRKK